MLCSRISESLPVLLHIWLEVVGRSASRGRVHSSARASSARVPLHLGAASTGEALRRPGMGSAVGERGASMSEREPHRLSRTQCVIGTLGHVGCGHALSHGEIRPGRSAGGDGIGPVRGIEQRAAKRVVGGVAPNGQPARLTKSDSRWPGSGPLPSGTSGSHSMPVMTSRRTGARGSRA